MKILTLVRHAKSSRKEPWTSDFDRPLNGRGKRDAPEMGARLAAAGARPSLVVSSPARRARKTARILAEAIDYPKKKVREEPGIYEADAGTLLKIVRNLPGKVKHAMLVGHNPGFTDLAEELTGETIGNLPTCGMVTVEFDAANWGKIGPGRGRLVHFDYPKRKDR